MPDAFEAQLDNEQSWANYRDEDQQRKSQPDIPIA